MGQPTAAAPGPRRLRFFEARNRRAAAFNPVKAWWGQPRDLGARKPRCAGGGSRVDEASGRADGPEARERGHRTNPRAATPIAVPAVKTRSWEPSPRPRGPGPGDQLPGARFTKTIRHGQKRSRARPGRGLTLPPADGAGRLVPALGAGSGGRLGPGERQPGPTGDLRVWAGQRVQGVCQERS
jgi:hypothetical protein